MAKFFFDLREGSLFVPDDDGFQFPDLETAEREAAQAAAELGRDSLPDGDLREVIVEVRNEHGQRLTTVSVSLTVQRVHPAPRPRG